MMITPSDRWIEDRLAAIVPPGAPGAIVRVEIAGAVVMTAAVGEVAIDSGRPLTIDHPFRLAATARPITAAAVLRLHEQGALDLDTPAAASLPTVRQLLSDATPLTGHAPDTPYVLLGRIMETACRRPLHEVYRRELFDRLDMTTTYLEGHEPRRGPELSHPYIGGLDGVVFDPDGGWSGDSMVSTVADLTRFGAAVLDGSVFDRRETVDEMLGRPGTGYGLGLYGTSTPGRLTMLGHDGYWGSVLLMIPELDLVLAATMNMAAGNQVSEAFYTALIDLIQPVRRP